MGYRFSGSRREGVNGNSENIESTERRARRGLELAMGVMVASAVLATSGIAYAGYRWGRSAPTTTTTTVKPSRPTTTVKPAVTPTSTPETAAGYRWG